MIAAAAPMPDSGPCDAISYAMDTLPASRCCRSGYRTKTRSRVPTFCPQSARAGLTASRFGIAAASSSGLRPPDKPRAPLRRGRANAHCRMTEHVETCWALTGLGQSQDRVTEFAGPCRRGASFWFYTSLYFMLRIRPLSRAAPTFPPAYATASDSFDRYLVPPTMTAINRTQRERDNESRRAFFPLLTMPASQMQARVIPAAKTP